MLHAVLAPVRLLLLFLWTAIVSTLGMFLAAVSGRWGDTALGSAVVASYAVGANFIQNVRVRGFDRHGRELRPCVDRLGADRKDSETDDDRGVIGNIVRWASAKARAGPAAGGDSGAGAGPAIFVANHQSFADLGIVGLFTPNRCVCVAKRSLQYIPFFGQVWSATGNLFIDRQKASQSVAVLGNAASSMKQKDLSIWIFVEGTRNRTVPGGLLPFKKGAFHMAVQNQVPIVPVIVSDCSEVCDGLGLPKSSSTTREVRIQALDPIETEGKGAEDVAALAEATRASMLAGLTRINAPGFAAADKKAD
jgi:1-acyl-sn-glycerol-3-phosphate acyltransferase